MQIIEISYLHKLVYTLHSKYKFMFLIVQVRSYEGYLIIIRSPPYSFHDDLRLCFKGSIHNNNMIQILLEIGESYVFIKV